MRKLIGLISVVVLTLGIWMIQPQAAVNFPWDILNRFLGEDHTWTGEQTIENSTSITLTAGQMVTVYGPGGATIFSTGGGTSSGNSPYMRGALDLMSSSYNVFVGAGAGGEAITDAGHNVGVGRKALNLLTEGDYNMVFGSNAGDALTDGEKNVAIGYAALSSSISGAQNVGIGHYALINNKGDENVAIGASALAYSTIASYNTAVGTFALDAMIELEYSTGIGHNALTSAISGYNTAVGASCLDGNTTGEYNTAIGYLAGDDITTGSRNLLIGYGAGNGMGNLSDILAISNAPDATPLIQGDFAEDFIRINGTFVSGASGACTVPDSGTSLEAKYYGTIVTHDQAVSTIYGMAPVTASPTVYVKFIEGAVGTGITIYNVNGEPFMGDGLSGVSYLALPPDNPFETCTIYSTQLSGTCKYWFAEASAAWVAGN